MINIVQQYDISHISSLLQATNYVRVEEKYELIITVNM